MTWFGGVNCTVFSSLENREITDLVAPNQYGTPQLVLTDSHPSTSKVRDQAWRIIAPITTM